MTPAEGRLSRRLERILLMLPFIIGHPGVTIAELAERFDAKRRDILADLDMIFLCGVPGYGPGDLIDVAIDGDRVSVDMADYFKDPLNLTPDEALALYSSAAAIATLPGMEQADALRRALAKLRAALGLEGEGGGGGIEIEMEAGGAAHLEVLQEALVDRRRVHLEYMAASTGELSEREVDPWGLFAATGHWYLVGHDHRSGEERMFRTDRIKSAVLAGAADPVPEDFDPEPYRGGFSGRGRLSVTLEISPETARWFEDYYPVSDATALDDGWMRVTLVAGGTKWAATLVLRLGAGVRDVRPREVAREARHLARSVSSLYG